ncbi:MAG: hypothetical protein ACRDNY_09570 [Gaiellaceae bacterium]
MFGAVCLGCGLLLGRAARAALPFPLLLSAGFAVIVVVSGFTTAWSETAAWTVPVVVALAAVGLVLARPRWPGAEARTVLAVAAVTFLVFGSPVIFSGEPTFAGYVKLDDTATFLALIDRALEHGRDLTGLAPSSYEATLAVNLENGYPLGALTPLGVGAKLVGTDPAWLWQPFTAVAAALLAMTLYALSAPLQLPRLLRACVAVLAAQAALLYGYALWGGSKEVVAAGLLALGAATTPYALRAGGRQALLPAVAWAAFLSVLSVGGALWLAPLALIGLGGVGGARARVAVTLGLKTVVLSLPTIVAASTFLRAENVSVFRSGGELGNLARPLRLRQVLGVWPTGDFRFDPQARWATWALIVLVAAAVGLGLVAAMRRRAFTVLALVASAAAATALVVAFGSPWLAGKALAIASPMLLFTAALGCAALLRSRRGITFGAVLAAALVAGVVGSNVLAYRAVSLAPHAQLAELERIDTLFAGQGPALMTEYQPYAVRHFLRRLDPEGASELRRRPIALRTGRPLAKGEYADIDEFRPTDVLVYRTLVLRRSPVASRPSAAYQLSYRGAWYEVWTRQDTHRVLDRLPLGTPLDPLARAGCADVQALASTATRAGGYLVASRVPTPIVAGIEGRLPVGWAPAAGTLGQIVPGQEGSVGISLVLPTAGRYAVWVGGSVRGRLRVLVDGQPVGTIRDHLNATAMWMRLGVTRLDRGAHTVALEIERAVLHPGSNGEQFALGPVALTRDTPEALRTVEPADAAALCAERLDWIEAVAP